MLSRVLFAVGLLASAGAPGAEVAKAPLALPGHRGGVTAVAFAPNGVTIATGSGNGLVRVWDAKTGKVLFPHDPMPGSKVTHIGFSADGKLMSVAASKWASVLSVADPQKRKVVFDDTAADAPPRFGGVSGDSRRVYTLDGGALRYFDFKDAADKDATTRPTDFSVKEPKFTTLAFAAAPDADSALAVLFGTVADDKPQLAFVGLGDKWVLTDPEKGGQKVKPNDKPNGVGFSPDGKWLVLCSGGTVMVWEVPGSQKVSGPPRYANTGPYYAAAAGPNNLLAVAVKEKSEETGKVTATVHLYQLDPKAPDPKPCGEFKTDIKEVSALAFAPDGRTLAVADNAEGTVYLWALAGVPKK